MLDMLQSWPSSAWIGMAAFAWTATAISICVTIFALWPGECLGGEPVIVVVCLLAWPWVLIGVLTHATVKRIQRRRVCPKCKSHY